MSFYTEIIQLILSKHIQTKQDLHRTKIKLCKKYGMKTIPPDSEILSRLPDTVSEEERDYSLSLLQKKPMRTISGVAIVAVMTSPAECPHGRCIPCPGGPTTNTPQSYTGYEPAAMRAALNDYDPYLQTKNRIEQLRIIGHPTDKIDFIIMGGTFTARTPYYKEWFVKRCFDALNQYTSPTLFQAKKRNEAASSRCIGLTLETRPDWFSYSHADEALSLGATRVELGVQTVYDNILFGIKRGHTVYDTIAATRIAKESGFKVCYHTMPGLPGSTDELDIASFHTIFEDQHFKPDMLKIYPTLTVPGTELYKQWKKGEYSPLSTMKATRLLSRVKSFVPEWIRIQRIQRDVPAQYIHAGVKKSNLRQLIDQEMTKHGSSCHCIRCREVGHRSLRESLTLDETDIELMLHTYQASEGTEIFISLEAQNLLIAYLRLRNLERPHRYELQREPCMIIRELKVLGRELSLGEKKKTALQHKGYGKELIKEAERICIEEFDKKKLLVLSGIGVKEYYRRLGYADDGLYVCKRVA